MAVSGQNLTTFEKLASAIYGFEAEKPNWTRLSKIPKKRDFYEQKREKSQTMELWELFRDKNSGFKMGNLKEPEGSNVKNEVSLSQKVKSEVQQQNGENSSNSTNSSGSGKISFLVVFDVLVTVISKDWIDLSYYLSFGKSLSNLGILGYSNKAQDPGYLMRFFGRFSAQYFLGSDIKTRDNLSRLQPGTSRMS